MAGQHLVLAQVVKEKLAIVHEQFFPRRHDIDMIRFDFLVMVGLADRHPRAAGEDLGHQTVLGRIEMLDDDKGHAGIRRHRLKEQFQGLQPPGRSADRHHREGEPIAVLGEWFSNGRGNGLGLWGGS